MIYVGTMELFRSNWTQRFPVELLFIQLLLRFYILFFFIDVMQAISISVNTHVSLRAECHFQPEDLQKRKKSQRNRHFIYLLFL